MRIAKYRLNGGSFKFCVIFSQEEKEQITKRYNGAMDFMAVVSKRQGVIFLSPDPRGNHMTAEHRKSGYVEWRMQYSEASAPGAHELPEFSLTETLYELGENTMTVLIPDALQPAKPRSRKAKETMVAGRPPSSPSLTIKSAVDFLNAEVPKTGGEMALVSAGERGGLKLVVVI